MLMEMAANRDDFREILSGEVRNVVVHFVSRQGSIVRGE
jgi:hypothetical protein